MRAVNRGEIPLDKKGNPKIYTHYRQAKDDLIDRLGSSCSYCEMNVANQVDIEHIIPKSKNPKLEKTWSNFILSCKICNILKDNINDNREGYVFPDIENTSFLYEYSISDIKVKDNLESCTKYLATATFNLVQLNRKFNTSNQIDDRRRARNNAWKKAQMALKDYIKLLPTTHDKNTLANLTALTCENFFSLWLQVFKDYPEVKKAILENVKGTAIECYDKNYNPIENIQRKPMSKLYAIFGNPVSHSKSPLMHNFAFRGLKFDGIYTRYLLEDGSRLKEKFLSLGLQGVNVTVPHKEEAFKACDVLDTFSQKVGVVNTIVNKNGKLYGYNTDAPGFLKAISEFKNIKTVLFLGAGGTAKSTSILLKDAGYEVSILNRSEGRLKHFEDKGFETFTFETFEPKAYDLIINMTSAGLEDENLPAPLALLESILPQSKACVDVIYGKETPFLKLAKSYNKPSKDGSDMLLYQGIIAFEHFTKHQYTFDEIKVFMQNAFV